MRKKILLSIAALLAVGAIAAYAMNRPEPADSRFSGAYELDDDSLVFITPREGSVLRYRMMNGESAALWPVGDGKYEGGTGWAEREPIVNRIQFNMDSDGEPNGFTWQHGTGAARHARALSLREQISRSQVVSCPPFSSDIFDRRPESLERFRARLIGRGDGARPWFETAKHSDSAFGMIIGTEDAVVDGCARTCGGTPTVCAAARAFIDRTLRSRCRRRSEARDTEPVAVRRQGLRARRRSGAVEELRKLQAEGKPSQYFVYPDVEHGIMRYTEDVSGERRYIGYAPEYFPRQMAWLREQSGL